MLFGMGGASKVPTPLLVFEHIDLQAYYLPSVQTLIWVHRSVFSALGWVLMSVSVSMCLQTDLGI